MAPGRRHGASVVLGPKLLRHSVDVHGLTFGSISALFGLTHDIIDQAQNSHLVATLIGSAVATTLVANTLFVPRYLLPRVETPSTDAVQRAVTIGEREG